MDSNIQVGAKLLAFEKQRDSSAELVEFLRARKVTGLLVRQDEAFWKMLGSNLRIGAIFLGGPFPAIKSILHKIYEQRREIPIFIRSHESELIDEFMAEQPTAVVVKYDQISDPQLTSLLGEYIFSRYYPGKLLQNLVNDFCKILAEQFSDTEPFLERILVSADRRMYGGRLEYMPIRSTWCAGAMLLETNTSDIANLVGLGRTHFGQTVEKAPLYAEDMIREVMNRFSGAFKNKYVPNGNSEHKTFPEIPMTVNHLDGYLSFGTTVPMLCLDFAIRDKRDGANEFEPFQMYLRLSFHSHWDPEDVPEEPVVQEAVKDGILEFF
ncbi:MAG: hypothetical protein VYA34_15050 [Myxococcota bacterium]|nr:hypothetical protein [Myxococcota bacterium]